MTTLPSALIASLEPDPLKDDGIGVTANFTLIENLQDFQSMASGASSNEQRSNRIDENRCEFELADRWLQSGFRGTSAAGPVIPP